VEGSLGTTAKYLRRPTSSAAGIGLCSTIKYLRGAAGTGLGTTSKYLRRTTSAAAGNGLGTTIKYLVNQNAGAGSNWAKAHYTKAVHGFFQTPCNAAAFEVNSEPHTGALGHVSRFVCVWDPSSFDVLMYLELYNQGLMEVTNLTTFLETKLSRFYLGANLIQGWQICNVTESRVPNSKKNETVFQFEN
jgi:hypothetical protein